MEKVKFSDLVHFERNDPAKFQHVFFDVTDEFAERLGKCLTKYLTETAGKHETQKEYLMGLSEAIDKEFGPLSVPEILATLQCISYREGRVRGYENGYETGTEEAMAKIFERTTQRSNPNATA